MKALLLSLLGAASAWAQMACFGGASLGDGIKVQFSLYTDGQKIEPQCKFEEGHGYLRRILDLAPGRVFGYELHVKRNPPGRPPFHVSVEPAKSVAAGYFPRNPEPVDVGPSETIEFVVLENRQSSLRLVERFRVYNDRDAGTTPRFNTYPSHVEPFPPVGTALHLASPKLTRNGDPVSRANAEVRGGLVWVWVPEKGRFWFSVAERGRFRKAARARDQRLEFEWNGSRYVLECAKSVVEFPGDWVLWVWLEEGWKPDTGGFLGDAAGATTLQLGAVGE